MRTALRLGIALLLAAGCNDNSDWNGPIDDAIVVNPGESIQAAVDAAPAGATIRVNPGDYVETHGAREAVRITKSLTLVANSRIPESRVRILPATGQRQGILVEPENPTDPDVDGVVIKGFTVEGFPNNGIWLRHVTNFVIEGNESINNLENGIWPTLSTNGEVKKNVSYGSKDSALWVEAAENVRVVENDLSKSPTGLEVTVSNDIYMEGNDVHDNVVGVGLYHPSGAGLPPSEWPPSPFRNWQLTNNRIHDNNMPNEIQGGLVSALPPGGGVLVLGVQDVTIGDNTIERNDFFGIALIDYCVAVDGTDNSCGNNPPYYKNTTPEDITITDNTVTANGGNPPPGVFAQFAGDILSLGAVDSCASGNTYADSFQSPALPPC